MLEWMNQHLIPKLAELTGAAAEGVRVSFDFGPYVEATEKAEVVGSDLTLAALPLPLGFIYLFLYTDSLFLSSLAALEIALAWPCALFLYRYIFGFHHFEELTLLASPLTAPFSLEAVSLLIDAWRASASQKAHVVSSLSARLSWTLRDAGFASSHSILVGMAGFASCAISPWLPIAHFGTFCALILAVQLLLALTFLPACLVIYHEWFETRTNLCCICCVPATTPTGTVLTAWEAIATLWRPPPQTTTERYRDSREIEASIGVETDTNAMPSSRIWPFPRMLAQLILPSVRQKRRRRVFIASLLAALVPIFVSISSASTADTPRGRLLEHHPLLATRRALDRSFDISSSEDTVRATLLWGANGVLTEGSDWAVELMRNSSFRGRLDWRDEFAFDEVTQTHIEYACSALRQQPWVQRDSERSHEGADGRVQCFIDDFKQWLAERRPGALPDFGTSFPVPLSKDPALALSTFLSSSTGVLWQPYIGTIGSAASGVKLRFVAVSANLMLRASANRFDVADNADRVLSFTAALNAIAPPSAGPALASADGVWAWMRAQRALPMMAILGSLRTASACLVVVFLLTGSVPLTLLAAVTVGCATMCMLAMLVASGWALSSTEAVLACATPSLLTPPAALILRVYERASRNGGVNQRELRAARAFERAGVTIISGWVAMSVALAPMLMCQLITEFKVAAALLYVAVCIIAWVALFLPVALAEVGPVATHIGLPLWGSSPWALLPLLPPSERYAIDDEPPMTWRWYLARRRKRQREAAAAAAEDARWAALHAAKQAAVQRRQGGSSSRCSSARTRSSSPFGRRRPLTPAAAPWGRSPPGRRPPESGRSSRPNKGARRSGSPIPSHLLEA